MFENPAAESQWSSEKCLRIKNPDILVPTTFFFLIPQTVWNYITELM